ncbi:MULTISPECIES: PDR/VanB family oxidoreductase [unclassified Streptomyces]|uniref:PDR/VanB family oxidoreductase n=1 Tax=unclassified Streptomyces TaxID=2593676 RepID=UPI001660AA0F|nr:MULTISPECIES: PDR/VanB family oxidoreductase [unclassified Streptomyces]MBD0712156.1 oxidoreductase [Streptomyces sp. CBMA291]MBD0713988.1 oxidoreductase [Streptomyces sp. CBMA370]
MTDPSSSSPLTVRSVVQEAEGVLGLLLADATGAELAPWEPGAHLEVTLPSGAVRHYSLCGDPADRSTYRLGVLREPAGRGGSEEIHTSVGAGTVLRVRGPFNRFPLVPAERYLFLAGGIGVTPLLPMVRALPPGSWSLLYGGRSLASMAYREELAGLPGVTLVPRDTAGLPDLDAVLGGLAPGTAVYCCGPEGLLRAVAERWRGPLHTERFGAAPSGAGAESSEGGAVSSASGAESSGAGVGPGGFEVELRRSGLTLRVEPGRSLLDVVREAVPGVAYSCEEGWCGTCETKVLAGVPEHHDEVLGEDERASGTTMMICVGRSRGPRLVLDV